MPGAILMDSFRDHIATVKNDGKRQWIFPKKVTGKLNTYRSIVGYAMLLFLFLAPFIHISGEQLILLDIFHRKFILFGSIFWPQDFYLLAIFLVTLVVFVILFTVIYGRLFCGWICPQTIFMDFIFRKIEYWIEGDWTHQKKLKEQSWTTEKIMKRGIKLVAFLLVSFIISNVFLSYIIGSDALLKLIREPLALHLGTFISLWIFTGVFFFVFWYLREQVCTTICPYGRLQGVLLDSKSIVVGYDHVRGEPRATVRKGEDRTASGKGACIDCHQCINVCPTGIDIRNGTQLECINCTACIDICDQMMVAVKQPTGLIRFISEDGIKNRTSFQWTKRVVSYTIVLAALIVVFTVLLFTRTDVEATVLRQRGTTFTVTEDDQIVNIFEMDITNKTHYNFRIFLKTNENDVTLKTASPKLLIKKEARLKDRVVIEVPFTKFVHGKRIIYLEVWDSTKRLDRVKLKLVGPIS
jgi:cytochrome c oxidase accessory protein FixG